MSQVVWLLLKSRSYRTEFGLTWLILALYWRFICSPLLNIQDSRLSTYRNTLSTGEFIALTALMISMVAMAIDAMLPALGLIGADLQVSHANDAQLVVTVLFLGLSIGQALSGPLSDRFGRRIPILLGMVIFIVGCLISMLAQDFTVMLIGRFLQGLGAAAPRIVSIALVRDQFQGASMARIMSMVMAVFILVPALAPIIGQGILFIADWRAIFAFFLILAVVAVLWFGLRQQETLPEGRRRQITADKVGQALLEVLSHRQTLAYTAASGFLFASFVGYLGSTQQVFVELYQTGTHFPYYFGLLALAIGAASLVNSRIVVRYGMKALCRFAFVCMVLLSLVFVMVTEHANGVPPFAWFMAYMLITFFCIGILFGNLNSVAMEPMGHIAGMASAVISSVGGLISIPLGWYIGYRYDGTILPLVYGLAGFSVAGLICVLLAGSDRGDLLAPVIETAD
ncbi:MAG: multidrug effflux MFS transporter [Pseudomonadales bacterium]|nr:multidrug effflux MFS transporter [Pseudomonadales bacterium]